MRRRTFLAFVGMKLWVMVGSEEGKGSEADGGPESSGDGSQRHCMGTIVSPEVSFLNIHKLRELRELRELSGGRSYILINPS